MQIKFRCQYCQQLLGISKSRAGARVDCPGCGRTISVPGTVSTDLKPHLEESDSRKDSSFDEALASLIRLSDSENMSRPKSSPPSEQGEETPESLIPDFDEAAVVIRELNSESYSSASQIQPVTDVEPASGTAAHTPRRGVSSLTVGVLCLLSFVFGGVVVEAWRQFGASSLSTTEEPVGQGTEKDILDLLRGDTSGESTDTTPASGASGSPQIDQTGTDIAKVTGVVKWVTDGGTAEPDSQALVLLLPKRRSSGLRFDGRSLRETASTPDQKALKAALREFGIFCVRTDTEGRFELSRTSAEAADLVVVSRHRSRPEGVEIPSAVKASLDQYFDSGLSFVGQLSVQQTTLPAQDSVSVAGVGDDGNSSSKLIEILIERN